MFKHAKMNISIIKITISSINLICLNAKNMRRNKIIYLQKI